MIKNTRHVTASAVAIATMAIALGSAWPGRASAAGMELVAHRAVYELRLSTSHGKSTVSARGRILYDFTGSACEGYTLDFRQVSELDNGEGKVTLSDLRSNTWEDTAAKSYKFTSQNFVNERKVDDVEGRSERGPNGIAVSLTKPKEAKFDLDATIVFPTEHVRRIIEAARENKTILEFPVYDGSESGEKVYNTLTVIGRAIDPSRPPDDVARDQKSLDGMKRWPVTVSYFDRNAPKTGEQTPVYAISFELYENGISRALMLDYNDFSIAGDLKVLEMKEQKACP